MVPCAGDGWTQSLQQPPMLQKLDLARRDCTELPHAPSVQSPRLHCPPLLRELEQAAESPHARPLQSSRIVPRFVIPQQQQQQQQQWPETSRLAGYDEMPRGAATVRQYTPRHSSLETPRDSMRGRQILLHSKRLEPHELPTQAASSRLHLVHSPRGQAEEDSMRERSGGGSDKTLGKRIAER